MLSQSKPELLSRVPLFSSCTRKELSQIAKLASTADARAGETLAEEGEPGREFFVVLDGEASVTVRGKTVATLGAGDFFGEMALLDLGPRAATVKADTDVTLLVIERRDFTHLLDEVPIVARNVLAGLATRLRVAQDSPTYTWNLPGTSWNRR